MPAEVKPKVWVTRGATVLPLMDWSFTWSYSEPAEFTFTLDNQDGTYGQDSAIADVRNASPTYLVLHIQTGEDTWASPQLRVKGYRSGPDETAIVTGRCRLCELDVNDQAIDAGDGISTIEGETAATIINTILTEYGLTQTGAPSRVIPTFDLVGNPLDWLGELLPDYVFRMSTSTAGQLLFTQYTSHGSGPALEDREHLEVVDFQRSDDIYNRATVERVVPQSGEIELLNVQQSWDAHPSPSVLPFDLAEPSRQISIRTLKGYRGRLEDLVLIDADDNPISGPGPWTATRYTGITPVAKITVDYIKAINADTQGPYKPNIEILITGYPLDVDPVPTEGYSYTASSGSGDKPFPEPFSLAVVPDLAAAQAVAEAKVEKGLRDGSILDLETRVLADMIPVPNGAATVTDYKKGFSAKAVIVETINLSGAEGGDSGTMALQTTFMET